MGKIYNEMNCCRRKFPANSDDINCARFEKNIWYHEWGYTGAGTKSVKHFKKGLNPNAQLLVI